MKEAGVGGDFAEMDIDEAPFAVDDQWITTEIEAPEFLDAKLDAMRAHASQIDVEGPFFALSDNLGSRAMGVEYYRLAAGTSSAPSGQREDDLFAGTSADPESAG